MSVQKTNKKISIAKLDKVMKEQFPNDRTIEWHGLDISIKHTLSVRDMLRFVADVVNSCFDEKTGTYSPEIKELMIRRGVLTEYANFNLPDKVEHLYELVYGTSAYDVVINDINQSQIRDIRIAIDDKLEHLKTINAERISMRLDEMANVLDGLVNSAQELFGTINKEDLAAVVKNLSEANISEESLLKAVVAKEKKSDEAAQRSEIKIVKASTTQSNEVKSDES